MKSRSSTSLTFFNRALSHSFFLVAVWSVAIGSAQVVSPKIVFKAEPFSLNDVGLLDGPFKHSQDLDHQYLLELEPDRMLSWYRKDAGLQPKAPVYGGWESQGVAGCILGHYLSACSEMYQATGDRKLLERVNYIVDELTLCQATNGNGYVAAIPDGKRIFSEIGRGILTSKGFDLNGGWVPFYTLHKELAGLRDAYRLCGNAKALQVARALADFIDRTLTVINHDQMQTILACEHGGMNEVLADLYADTGDKKYLALAQRFYMEAVLVPLTHQIDQLDGLHANTQIPKVIGLADLYELTGNTNDQTAAEFFWDRVAHHQSYVTGGNALGEHFGPPDKLNDRLGPNTTETCNVYNMLKLTRHIFEWTASPGAADFYERALYDHILASQNDEDGCVIYNLSLAMGGTKAYQSQFNSFTCCVGTGMENHALHGDAIYFHTDDSLFVNLFIASELNWKAKGLQIRQETKFPDDDTMTLIFSCDQPQQLTLHLRHPYWAGKGFAVSVNGKKVKLDSTPSSYMDITRRWQTGDRVEVTLPQSLHLQPMPDNPDRVAIMYGPLVLAGDLGPQNDPSVGKPDYVPVLVTDNRPPADWIQPVAGEPGRFRTVGVGRPRDVQLEPFWRVTTNHYTVYWDIFTDDQWKARQVSYEAERQQRLQLEARTVDFFQPGEMQPERDHGFSGEQTRAGDAGGHKWRDATSNGWFQWNMKTLPDQPMTLMITYWGSDSGGRVFDIQVNGEKVATQTLNNNQPEKYFEVAYPLPENLTKGKNSVTIRLQAQPGKMAGGIFGARTVGGSPSARE